MPNRLAHETSPYLQQHAGNPVDWYPWGEEALQRARAENKPILLSIGYSACHWCHVMAHESFEDSSVAAVMNAHFVNVKVDREERPDLDQIYQAAHQMLTRRTGGWPLTMFLTPDQVPFFGGTYFPSQSRYNLPGFVQVMEYVAQAYRSRRSEIEEQNRLVLDALTHIDEEGRASSLPGPALIERAVSELRGRFDAEHGGFGGAPKFPHPTDLELCLRRFASKGDRDALHVALHTLRKMAQGGIYDHIGGGFCRYAVDQSWTIPHFEKMLYDNAQLLPLYADAWTITREPLFERVVAATAGWVIRDMQSPQGGYYSSLDADSEGEEGKFYVWRTDEVRAILSREEYALLERHFGLSGSPNFVDHHAGTKAGAWHLAEARPLPDAAAEAGVSTAAATALLESARAKLFAARAKRVPPGRDEKVLTSWNALMIAGMARAAFVFDRGDWGDSARRAFDFIAGRMSCGDRLYASFKDERAHLQAYLDDYAYLIKAALALQSLSFSAEKLSFAERLASTLLDQFEDAGRGGFFFTGHDHEHLIHRPKSAYDNATPSGNGTAVQALVRLHHLTGNTAYLRSAERGLAAFADSLDAHPAAFSTMLVALEEVLTPPTIVVLRGDASEFPAWRRAFATAYHPSSVLIATDAPAETLPEPLAKPRPGCGVNAYVCRGASCLAPLDDREALRAALSAALT